VKPEYFLPIVVLPSLWFFARLAWTHHLTDLFLKELYANHRRIWEQLGKPCGWQWRAPGRIANPFSMFKFRWAWLKEDPEWLQQTPELRPAFQKIRNGVREWNFRAMPIMVASALIFFLIAKLLEH